MAESSLKTRLQEHAKAFDGLLSLIPAKIYYGGDNSDQWKKKKQTKAEADAALRAKLDPESIKTAKDVMDENARKRKLEETDDYSDIEGVEKELPKQGLRDGEKKNKKQKKDTDPPTSLSKLDTSSKDEVSQTKAAAAAEKKREKAEKRKEKQARKIEKRKAKNQNAVEDKVVLEPVDKDENAVEAKDAPAEDEESINVDADNEALNPISVEGLVEEQDTWSTASSSPAENQVFDKSNDQSANTSTSSVIPPAKAPKHIKLPSDPELLRKRLAAKIESLRAARKADAPARNRQELIESRRKKEEQRRAHKKELRRIAAIEEANRREEALASARDSPASSMMGSIRHSPEHNFSFGRVAFADGQQLTSDLTSLVAAPKKKGPSDATTALLAAEKKKQRISGFDDSKRADIEEKDLWLNAKKRAHGERVRDDTNLLKKTLKRKEKAKKKSEKEWTERKEGVAKGQAMRQKKREENLQKRKDGKGAKGSKGKSAFGKSKKKSKVKSRPGFEGSFSSKKR